MYRKWIFQIYSLDMVYEYKIRWIIEIVMVYEYKRRWILHSYTMYRYSFWCIFDLDSVYKIN